MVSSQLDQVIAPEIKDDELFDAIAKIMSTVQIGTVLEIGSSSGEGSTKAFVEGILQNPVKPKFYGMEVSLVRFKELQDKYQEYDFVNFYNASSIPLEKFPSQEEVIRFYMNVQSNLNQYPPLEVLRWLKQDIDYLKNHPEIPQDGIARIKAEHSIERFDCVLIDGSEFTGAVELEEVYGANIIILDDINTYKNYDAYQRLLQDKNYILAKCNPNLRNGYAIFRRADFATLPVELPMHFFTIVLNGQPFIQYHIEVFKQLPCRWHWHIVEGVADLKHDTAWSVKNGGKVTNELHKNGLSKDGTTEYIDQLIAQYPDNITVYRKPPGQFWDGKKEMVNAPLNSINEECLLWQVDIDELWTLTQIMTVKQLFALYPERTAALYWCWYFVGEHLVVSTRNCYSQNPHQEWLRTWRFQPGCRWDAHEPPILVNKQGKNLAKIKPFTHDETEKYGLIFQHFAYVTPDQIAFKEKYYGYKNAVEQWLKLQEVDQFPVHLKDYFTWVKDETLIDIARTLGVSPIAYREEHTDCWRFSYADVNDEKEEPRPICVIDGVIFQINPKGGIARVWSSLLQEWSKNGFAKHVVIIDRRGTAPRFDGYRYVVIEPYNPLQCAYDQLLLEGICLQYKADLFMSTYYTTQYKTPSIMAVYDMIPEMFGIDTSDSQWEGKKRAIQLASRYISISQSTANDLRLFYPDIPQEFITVTYPAVHQDIFHPANEEEIANFKAKYKLDKPYFLLVGDRVGAKGYKNASHLFRAFHKLPDKNHYTILCVGGNPNIENDVAKHIRSLDVRVHTLEDAELRSAYTGAVCLVYVSLYEGFGLPVLEAMSCGCPVITCDNSSLPEVAGDAALYVDGRSEELLVAKLCDVQRLETRNKLVEYGLSQSKKFCWQKMAIDVSNVIQETYLEVLANPSLFLKTYSDVNVNLMEKQIELLKAEISAMQRSKFWKIRNMWFKAKTIVGKIKRKAVKLLVTN